MPRLTIMCYVLASLIGLAHILIFARCIDQIYQIRKLRVFGSLKNIIVSV